MPALELRPLVQRLLDVNCHRHLELFTEFLPRGYRMTTLSSVPAEWRELIVDAKVKIGTLITLYDDLADNPEYADPSLLEVLYEIPFGRPAVESIDSSGKVMLGTVSQLWNEVQEVLQSLPAYALLAKVYRFDVSQFFQANRYSELLREQAYLNNTVENRAYVSHNMGILIVGTIDLMASSGLELDELGTIRSLFYRAQQAARLMNVVSTLARERAEGDTTGELSASRSLEDIDRSRRELRGEISQILTSLRGLAEKIKTFDGVVYLQGMQSLHDLHRSMEGTI